jgi:membrane fusion protein (multidrug efflux system)
MTHSERFKMSGTLWVLAVLGLLIIGVFAVRIVQLSEAAPVVETVDEIRVRQGIPVVVRSADQGTIEMWRPYTGTVSGEREAILRARNDDEVREIRVQVGDRVNVGDLLVRQVGAGSEARIQQVTVALELAERQVERLRPLWEAGALSDQRWEEANAQLAVARSDRNAVRELQDGTAPIRGVVTDVPGRVGMIPSQGMPLVQIVDDTWWRVTLRVSPEQAAELQIGQRAVISGGASDDAPVLEGRIERTAIQANPRSRLVEIEARFPGGAATPLRPGSLASVRVLVDARQEVVRIPREGLRPEGVWILLADGTATLRSVETGLRGDDWIEIRSGVSAGEAVVVEGTRLLSEGAAARVVR